MVPEQFIDMLRDKKAKEAILKAEKELEVFNLAINYLGQALEKKFLSKGYSEYHGDSLIVESKHNDRHQYETSERGQAAQAYR